MPELVRHPMPAEFFWIFSGAVCGGAIAFYLVYRLVTSAGSWRRLRGAWADEGASAVVEFPFVLIVLIIIILMTSQLAFMAAAYLVVDLAAFHAARSAIVIVPENRPAGTPQGAPAEAANQVASGTLERGVKGKGDDIRMAAVLSCYPIAGTDFLGTAVVDETFIRLNSTLTALGGSGVPIPGFTGDLRALSAKAAVITRYFYSTLNTSVKLINGAGQPQTSFSGSVTAEVTHWFSLQIPYARRMFQEGSLAHAWQADMVARATMIMEPAQGKTPPNPATYTKPN